MTTLHETSPPLTHSTWLSGIQSAQEMILSNLAMIAQTPAPTFEEDARAEFLMTRFVELGLNDVRTDDMFNTYGFLNDEDQDAETVLIFTHMDNTFPGTIDQNVTLTKDRAYGAGVIDDNIALATLLTLPDIFSILDFKPSARILLLATSHFHGRGDYAGIRHFMKTMPKNLRIARALNIVGLELGAVNYIAQSRVRGDIVISTENIPQKKLLDNSAILVANHIMDDLFSIPLPHKPKTTFNIGMISGGERYSTSSREAHINFEALSDDDAMMESLIEQIHNHCMDNGAKHAADVKAHFFGRHRSAALTSSHPFVRATLSVINELGINPKMSYTNTEIAVTLAENIPSISIGLTYGEGGNTAKSYALLEPLYTGILQLLLIINSMNPPRQ